MDQTIFLFCLKEVQDYNRLTACRHLIVYICTLRVLVSALGKELAYLY